MSFHDTSIQETASFVAAHETLSAKATTDRGLSLTFECRSTARVNVKLNAQLASLDPDSNSAYSLTNATTRDVCAGGLGLSIDAPLRVGLRVVVELEVCPDQWMVVPGRVAWASEDEDGRHICGVAFTQTPPGKLLFQ